MKKIIKFKTHLNLAKLLANYEPEVVEEFQQSMQQPGFAEEIQKDMRSPNPELVKNLLEVIKIERQMREVIQESNKKVAQELAGMDPKKRLKHTARKLADFYYNGISTLDVTGFDSIANMALDAKAAHLAKADVVKAVDGILKDVKDARHQARNVLAPEGEILPPDCMDLDDYRCEAMEHVLSLAAIAGAKWMALCRKLERDDAGKRKSHAWDYMRQAYKDLSKTDPDPRRKDVYEKGWDAFKKATGKEPDLTWRNFSNQYEKQILTILHI
jgi:hypothetical protein